MYKYTQKLVVKIYLRQIYTLISVTSKKNKQIKTVLLNFLLIKEC